MSLIRLGGAATRRQIAPLSTHAPREGLASAAGAPPATGGGSPMATMTETETATEKAFQQLVQYIPTETVTLFLAAVSLVASLEGVAWAEALRPYGLIAIFTVLTPLMLLLGAYATFREGQHTGQIPKDQAFKLPKFELFASAVAFVPWAFAVPGLLPEPSSDAAPSAWTQEVIHVFAAFAAFGVSWILSQLRRIVGPS